MQPQKRKVEVLGCERAWNDLNGKDEESNMLKHWEYSHEGEGDSNFRLGFADLHWRDRLEKSIGSSSIGSSSEVTP